MLACYLLPIEGGLVQANWALQYRWQLSLNACRSVSSQASWKDIGMLPLRGPARSSFVRILGQYGRRLVNASMQLLTCNLCAQTCVWDVGGLLMSSCSAEALAYTLALRMYDLSNPDALSFPYPLQFIGELAVHDVTACLIFFAAVQHDDAPDMSTFSNSIALQMAIATQRQLCSIMGCTALLLAYPEEIGDLL